MKTFKIIPLENLHEFVIVCKADYGTFVIKRNYSNISDTIYLSFLDITPEMINNIMNYEPELVYSLVHENITEVLYRLGFESAEPTELDKKIYAD